MTLPAVTKHLNVLERAGLIVRGREAQWRPCALRAAPLGQAAGWLDEYRQHWEQKLDRLEAYLQKLQASSSGVQSTKQLKLAARKKRPTKRSTHVKTTR
jgi:hypothetical protein